MSHWRDHLNSTLLGAYSLYDGETDKFKQIDGFIVRVCHEQHLLGASGKRDCFVAYTSLDQKKPMKINVTIANAIGLAAKTRNPDKWINVPVTFFVDEKVNTKDGVVEALRLKGRIVQQQVDYTAQITQLRSCKTIAELQTVYTSAGFPQTALVSIKDEMKTKLS